MLLHELLPNQQGKRTLRGLRQATFVRKRTMNHQASILEMRNEGLVSSDHFPELLHTQESPESQHNTLYANLGHCRRYCSTRLCTSP